MNTSEKEKEQSSKDARRWLTIYWNQSMHIIIRVHVHAKIIIVSGEVPLYGIIAKQPQCLNLLKPKACLKSSCVIDTRRLLKIAIDRWRYIDPELHHIPFNFSRVIILWVLFWFLVMAYHFLKNNISGEIKIVKIRSKYWLWSDLEYINKMIWSS